MKQREQFGAHPDAEVLNGFAEQALGAVERDHVLGHLAVCARCRLIVALVREAAAAERPVVASARQAWFGGWRMAWAPAVAMAAVVLLAVFVYVRHRDVAGEMASVEVPVRPSAELGLPAPGPGAIAPVEQAQEKKQAPGKSAPEPVAFQGANAGLMTEVSSVEAVAPPPAPMAETADKTASFQMAEARELQQAAAASDAEQSEAPSARAGSSRMKMAVASAAPVQAIAGSVTPAPAMHTMAAAPAANQQLATAAKQASVLPGGQPVVSSAASGAVTVTIDAGGKVYVSRDRAQHWEPVKQQWTGRSIRVEWKASASVFELTNDQNRIWMSTDGAIWAAR